jgi:hypothetical protein
VTSPSPLVAGRVDTTGAWAGIGLADDIELLIGSFESNSWIDGAIGGLAGSLDALATVVDPLGQVVSWGVAWLIEHVKPLSDALDWLAGDPDQISAYARTWTNVATAMRDAAADLDAAVRADLVAWRLSAAEAYRRHAASDAAALRTLGLGATAMSTIAEGTGLVVALVREVVRDLIADFVSVLAVRLWEWLAIAGGTLGLGTPWVAAQVSSLAAKWAAKISRVLTALISSLRRLAPMLGRLNGILDELQRLVAQLARRGTADPSRGSGPTERGPDPGESPPLDGPHPPDFDDATIDSRKITDYAMNPEHPMGRHKYRVINSATGLGPQDADIAQQQIAEGVRAGTPIAGRADEFGQRWNVDVQLVGPTGTITVRTAWIVEPGSSVPRMTTISFPPKDG